MNSLNVAIAPNEQVALWVPDMRCSACSQQITATLETLDVVEDLAVDLAAKKVMLRLRQPRALDGVLERLREAGFSPVTSALDASNALRDERKQLLARLGVAGIGMMQVMMYAITGYVAGSEGLEPAYEALFRWASMGLALLITLYSAGVFHEGAFRDLRHGRLGMDVPVSLAILSACGLSIWNTLAGSGEVYFDTVAMFTFFLLIARYVESSGRLHYAQTRELVDILLPQRVTLSDGGEVALTQLASGMRISIAAGDVIAADGLVRHGQSTVSESAFTGEVLPVLKRSGDSVLAGTRNLDASLVIEVTKEPGNFLLDRLSRLHDDALAYRPPFARLADRIARYFVGTILLLAALAGSYWFAVGSDAWFQIMLTTLVVSCPCALSLATPVAYTVATTVMRQQGLVVSEGAFLEKLADVDHIALDKTGTLTTGRIQIVEYVPAGMSEAVARQVAAALEQGHQHPIARAFTATPSDLDAREVTLIAGQGVSGVVAGVCYRLGSPDFIAVAPPRAEGLWIGLREAENTGWFRLADSIADDASIIRNLTAAGVTSSVLTGDGSSEAQRVGAALGINDVQQGLDPEAKVTAIRRLQDAGRKVLMVGDGVNDTGAMGAALTSMAVRPVDSFVQTAADATLLGDTLARLPWALDFSRAVRRVIRQNIAWALAYNLAVIPLAVSGQILPWMAALGMSLSSILVVANARRLAWRP